MCEILKNLSLAILLYDPVIQTYINVVEILWQIFFKVRFQESSLEWKQLNIIRMLYR